jgi:hypothetical protein
MNIEEKIKQQTIKECENIKYFYVHNMVGIIANIFNTVGVPRVNPIPQEYFDIIKDVICDLFCGGCEPEFEDASHWDEWDTIDNKHFVFITEDESKDVEKYGYNKRSPYSDKTIHYLIRLLKS